MNETPRGSEGDATGGMPVGRLAGQKMGGSSRTAPGTPRRGLSSALPLVILALVAGLGIGLAIGLLIGKGTQEAATATTTVPANGTGATTSTTGGTDTTNDTAPAFGVVTVSGEALTVLQQGVEDTSVGRPVPEISGFDFSGNPHAITADGTAKLIVALAHWCPYCNQELPVLRDWYDAGGVPDDVELILLSVFADPSRDHYPPSTWLVEMGWNGPVITDDAQGSLAAALGIGSVPYNLLVTPEGTVAARVTGGLSAEQLDGAIGYLTGLSATTTTVP